MNKAIKKTFGALALMASSVLPISVARADDRPILPVPETPVVVTSRNTIDKDGFSTQDTLRVGDMIKLYGAKDYEVVRTGADLKFRDLFKDGISYRLNTGRIYDGETGSEQSRALLEATFDKRYSPLDLAGIEYQNLGGRGVYSGSLGLKFGDLKIQGTANSDGDLGFGAIFPVSESLNLGFGGKDTEDRRLFDAAFDYKLKDGSFKDYSFKGHFKFTDFKDSDKKDNLEARLRFGDKVPGGAFLVGVQDTLFNTLTAVDDVTFPFTEGKFDWFGVADSISGKPGSFGFDLKYKGKEGQNGTLNMGVAVGLGDLTSTFFKATRLQADYKFDFDDSNNNVFGAELRTKLFESSDKNFQIDAGFRYEHPMNNDKDDTSFFLGGSWKF